MQPSEIIIDPILKSYLSREVKIKKEFNVEGTFESKYAAENWLDENGYSCGSSCAQCPTAIMKGDYYDYDLPHKWKNFTPKQLFSVHGAMISSREGVATVYIFADRINNNNFRPII